MEKNIHFVLRFDNSLDANKIVDKKHLKLVRQMKKVVVLKAFLKYIIKERQVKWKNY